jgi:hypothetical protein
MELPDPFEVSTFEMAEIFCHAPTEFEFKPSKLFWKDPCWIEADILLSPKSPAACQKFFTSLKMPHEVDAFGRVPLKDQLWKTFYPRLQCINGKDIQAWYSILLNCCTELTELLKHPQTVFSPPFSFAARKEFTTVDLATILKIDPDSLSVYLAIDRGSSGDYCSLRIHSTPPFLSLPPKCYWYEKRTPDNLHQEDFLPWFVATIERLPKKHRPSDPHDWANRLLKFHPHLAIPTSGIDRPWTGKPRLVFVLGSVSKVGYRPLVHLERRDIKGILRQDDMIRVEGIERLPGVSDKEIEIELTIHLVAVDGGVM